MSQQEKDVAPRVPVSTEPQQKEEQDHGAALLPVDASASPASTEALTNKEGGCSEAALQPSESAPLASESARSIPDEYREGFQNGMKHIASVVADLSDAVKWANENGGASNWPCSMCGFGHSAIIDLSYEWDCERREKQALFDLAEYRDALAGLLESIGTERAPRAMARARYVLEKFGSGNPATPEHSATTNRSAAQKSNASCCLSVAQAREDLEREADKLLSLHEATQARGWSEFIAAADRYAEAIRAEGQQRLHWWRDETTRMRERAASAERDRDQLLSAREDAKAFGTGI